MPVIREPTIPVDQLTGSVPIVDYDHSEIHAGSHFFVVGYQDLSNNQVLQFSWQMPDTTKESHWVWSIGVEVETLWEVYEDVTVTTPLANAYTPLNNDRNSDKVSSTEMRFGIFAGTAAANAAIDVSGLTPIKNGIVGAGRIGGSVDRESETMMKRNSIYCLRATPSAAGYINFDMRWYEHTDRRQE